jgi:hypothetical protein
MEKLITVTGLPRSGTAFVSMLLQLHPECMSYHELAAYDRDWVSTILDNEADIVADCSTYGFMPEARMPSYKRVMIDSDAVQSKRSAEIACRKDISLDDIIALQVLLYQWQDRYKPFVIDRNQVFTVEGCCDIWEYCFNGSAPVEKIQQLVKLNVQHKDAHIRFGSDVEFIL